MKGAIVTYKGRQYYFAGPPSDHIFRQLSAGIFYELDLLEAIRGHERQGVYIDVGACLGSHSVFFAGECPSSSVIAIEPNQLAHRYLVRNTFHHTKIVRINAAVHDSWTSCSPEAPSAANNIGMYRARKNGTVLCIRLDDLMGYEPVVIKIDVEGLETAVLRSGAKLLATHKPLLAIEAHDVKAREAVEAILFPLGYRCEGVYAKTPTYIYA